MNWNVHDIVIVVVTPPQIQSRLSVIEHESGTLESSYQNLTSIQEMVESLVVGLSISRDDEEILLHHPHEVCSLIHGY